MVRINDFGLLLGRLSIEEKLAQMLVFGQTGTMADFPLIDFIRTYGLGGLRVSPNSDRKAGAYMPPASAAGRNAYRPPAWREKFLDTAILPRQIGTVEYAEFLNGLRAIAFERRGLGLPLHVVADFESGGGNFTPRGMMNLPAPMGFGKLGDLELIERVYESMARQVKAVGIDWIHSPVVDVNVNPYNPEIQIRSFGADPELVARCAAAQLRGLRRGGLIGSLKHYPGRGDSAEDAHFGANVIRATKEEMYGIHLAPYRELIASGEAESVMIAHTVFPALDGEIATVSERLVDGILRGELDFDGVVTTDSLTMGGLMEQFTVAEASIRAVLAGCDLLLMKAENALRFELHEALAAAVRSGRIPEERIDRAVLRIWELKQRYGLFEHGGAVDPQQATAEVEDPAHYELSLQAARRVIEVVRDREALLPLAPERNLLVVDRVSQLQLRRNNDWNYPGMFGDFLRRHSENFTYLDYCEENTDRVHELIPAVIDQTDLIVVTAEYNRNDRLHNSKEFVRSLLRYGKPVVLLANCPYPELLIPDEIGTVVVMYEIMREQLTAAAELLFDQTRIMPEDNQTKETDHVPEQVHAD